MSHPYNRAYFDGEGYGRGKGDFYRDYPQHYMTADYILQRKPESVLELGGGRGYICKILQANGVKATCMDISEHCWHTRATDDFLLWDATRVWVDPAYPGKFPYDLCFSIAFLEHVPEEKLSALIKEMARWTKRGFHGITFTDPNSNDKTHVTLHPKEWWIQKFKEVAPDYPVEIVDKEDLEKPREGFSLPSGDGLVKLNIGCFQDMFYYGWENIDSIDLTEWAKLRGYKFTRMDVVKESSRIKSDSVDIILASHFIEHLTREEGVDFLKECLRVLKPDGLLRLAIPDSRIICVQYINGKIMENAAYNISVEKAEDESQALFDLLLSGHKTVYDTRALRLLLEKLTFAYVAEARFNKSISAAVEKQTIGMYPTISAYVEARKPETPFTFSPASLVCPTPSVASETHARADKLKIALISTPFLRTPPDSYGGTEQIVADLGEALAELGHDVTVFAANGSKVQGCKVVVFGEPKMKVHVDWLQAEKEAYDVYKGMLKDFDIIHGNNWLGFEYAAKTQNPKLRVLHTHHGGLNVEWWGRTPRPDFSLNLVAISRFMSDLYAVLGFPSKYAYNGINLGRYPFQKEKGDRLLFVGRIDNFKQPHVAIEVAKRLNLGLDIVGGTFIQDPAYLEKIKSLCDGSQIRFHPDVPHEVKIILMQTAKCLLFPSQMGEPFGLVACEAMACGTPVVALNDGAIEEVVQEGGTVCKVFQKTFVPQKGVEYHVLGNPVDCMCKAVQELNITPETCRRNAEKFSREKMANRYLWLYRSIISGETW